MRSKSRKATGGDSVGNLIVAGNSGLVCVDLRVGKADLPAMARVNISAELESIRTCLRRAGGVNARKAERALDDAIDEAGRAKPDRDEVGNALSRAVDYARTSEAFAEQLDRLTPHLSRMVTWLGASWQHLLDTGGSSK